MIIHRNIKLLNWLNFCLDFRIYGAITILYFAQVTGSYALGLSIFSIGTIASSLFEVPTGVFSDLVGRKMTVVFGQLASVFAIVSYAIGGSFAMLALGAVLEGLSFALFSGNNSALLYDSLKEENREAEYGEYEGKTSSMFQFALAVSALIGSVVLGWWTFKVLFWLSVIPQVVGFFIAFGLVEPKRHYQKIETNVFEHLRDALRKFKENAKLRTLSFAKILDHSIGESMHQFSPAFLATLWPVWAISLARVLSHIFAASGYRVAGRLIKKFGELRVLLWGGSANFAVGTAIIAYPTIATPLINSLTSFGFGTGIVAQSSLLQKEFSDEQRATMSSLTSLAGSLFFAIAAFVLGTWADKVGPTYALLTGQLLSISVLFLYWRLFKNNR